MSEDKSCKTPRWRMLKAQLNNLAPKLFKAKIEASSNAVLVDVRTASEYQQAHLPNAIHINYFAEDFWDQVEQLDANKSYFIYCRSGRRSIRVCTLMRNGGFDNMRIFNLDGGILAWQEEFGS